MSPVADRQGRPLRNLRISVTDRCNLRCAYCMPEEHYAWLPRRDILSFEEIATLVDAFTDVGIDRVRLTGGEPLLRHGLPALVRLLAAKPALRDLAMTTNGVLLAEQAAALKEAGLHRLTVSLDTLRPERFEQLTRRDSLAQVLEGIRAADAAGFRPLKIDTVVMRGVNDDELAALIEFARPFGAEVRFIEYMDVGGATHWQWDKVYARDAMLADLGARYGRIEPLREESSAPADRFRLADGTVFGIISSTTQPFCRSCDRARLTADGLWYLCLYARLGTDLRQRLRAGAPRAELADFIAGIWGGRTDRGAEQRLAARDRSPLLPADELQRDPHLEMHTRGG
ncbi:MAG: GTP 3',8-cyclase MoaA [Deltaproteobacteria bacterium]|nr:GTP 3',8-cyclase MoaA [Deltaproteobacteria bacterium]